jgi:hypothetical protein
MITIWRQRCSGRCKNDAAVKDAASRSGTGNLPYGLPNTPPLMYISAVSRPNTVLEVQVTREKPRSLIAAFRGIMMREIPGAL